MWGEPIGGSGHRAVAEWVVAFKLLWWIADYSYVRRSTLALGLSLAVAGLTLAGIGEWATGHFEPGSSLGGLVGSPETPSYPPAPPLSSPSAAAELPPAGDYLPAPAPAYTFRHDVPEVRLQFTVADERGRLVRDLAASDVEVFDDQAPVKRFSDFQRDEDLPLQLGLVLDTSDSVKRALPQERQAATSFLQRVMRPQTDVAYVMGVGGDVKTWQKPTAERQQLIEAIDQMKEPGSATLIYDALYSASSEAAKSTAGKNIHRAVIVLTDGYDTDSLHTADDVIAAAQRSETQIYPLAIHSPKIVTRGDTILSRIAESTGGRLYVAGSAKDLDAAFAAIEQDLRTQFYVSFPPQASTPGYHSLRLRVRSPKKLQIHARQGYYAIAQ